MLEPTLLRNLLIKRVNGSLHVAKVGQYVDPQTIVPYSL